ncbi:DUF5119 domain-containing protein [Parabacteroides chinchillae]|uniref:DUF5119 domain-containing protein n=1 Tax=Parabacteroides chinchillae TaxID=871327 RepID=A0A8G2BY26_9BACT|nr:DUF5119 domain-containing protein [Parabacteroides chinchillae]SEG05920.1 protein of unknown function [Parabacteroides chinchillae]
MNREISQMEISYGRWLQTLCLSLLVFVSSCTYGDTDRYSAKGKGKVFISLDWKGQALSSKTRFYFYPSGSDTPVVCEGDGSGYEGVLPAGTYKMVMINSDFENIYLQTDKGYDQAYAHSLSASGEPVSLVTRAGEPVLILPPGNFYGTGLADVQVDGSLDKIYTVYPRKLVCSVLLDVKIKGSEEVSAIEGTLTGVSPSVHIPSGKASYNDLVAVPVPLSKQDGGHFRSEQTVFGLTPDIDGEMSAGQNKLVLDITLVDGNGLKNELDITELINEAVSGDASGTVEATIELELVIDTSCPEGLHLQLVGWHTGTGSAGNNRKEGLE